MSFFSLFAFLRYHKTALSMAIAFMIAESAVSLALPFLIGQFSAQILEQQNALGLGQVELMATWVGLIVVQAALRFQATYRTNLVGAQVLNDLSCRLYDHIQMLPLTYFSQRKKGEILSLISNDATQLSYFLSGVLTGLIPATLLVLGAIILMAQIHLTIALVIIFTVPALFFFMKVLGRNLRPISEQVVKRQASGIAIATENFGAMPLLKSFSREQHESSKFRENAKQILGLRQKQLRIQALISPFMQMLISIGVVIIVVTSALHYQSGQLSISALVTLLMYGLLFAKPMSTFAGLYGQLQQARGASTRVIDVFNLEPETDDTADQPLTCPSGEIQCQDLCFGYHHDNLILNQVNARFEAGQVSVIFGENGAGKSSFINLLMRFMAPLSGRILIDNQDIAHCRLPSVRQHIGLVSQDIALCNGNIYDNIAYGLPDASIDDIIQASSLAGADSFIRKLIHGYDTQVGDNGVLLSGGQRQRISLARALLLDPKILLFDEPTSFADEEGKREFALLLAQYLNNKTIIIVTHDKNLRELAHQMLVLKQGRLTPVE